ncbi:MAG: hypothetical protein QE271_10675 [Bacteriovoracaceae bacterium]|nr:hypothetical protein [Bacteriovoracaceae bacterium]
MKHFHHFFTLHGSLLFLLSFTLLVTTTTNLSAQSSNSASYAQTKDDLEKDLNALKFFRTYYFLELETAETHQFEAWFHTEKNGWDNILVAADEKSNVANFSQSDYISDQTVRAGWPTPSSSYTPVPAELSSVSDGIVESYKKNFPDKKFDKFEIHYLGFFARVSLHEIIPGGSKTINNWRTDKKERSATLSHTNLAVSAKNKSIKELGQASSGGHATLNADFANEKTKISQWMDFQLPADAQGSSLLSLKLEDDLNRVTALINNETHAKVKSLKDQLFSSLLKTVSSWQDLLERNKKPKSPLPKILKSSEKSPFPSKSQQYINLEFNLYGRVSDFSGQLNKNIQLIIPVTNNNFEVQETIPDINVSVNIKGNLITGEIFISVFDDQGNRKEVLKKLDLAAYQVAFNEKTGFGFVDGYLEFMQIEGEGQNDLFLPGNGSYRRFDFFLQGFQSFDLTFPGLF